MHANTICAIDRAVLRSDDACTKNPTLINPIPDSNYPYSQRSPPPSRDPTDSSSATNRCNRRCRLSDASS